MDSARLEENITKRRKKVATNFDIPGVVKVILNELTQTSLGLVVGSNVSGEYPWRKVNKELLYDNISVLADNSAFSYYKPELDAYEEDEILFGYIYDDLKLEDEFYLCLTREAKEQCEVQVAKLMKKQVKKLDKYIFKNCGQWKSLGSEKEVEESHVTRSRPLIQIEYMAKKKNNPPKLSVRDTYDCVSIVPKRENFDIVVKRRTDVAIQAISEKTSSYAQTTPKFPQNMWTQCSLESHEIFIKENETLDEQQKTELEAAKQEMMPKVKEFLDKHIDNVENIVKFNATVDIYNMDYPDLAKKGGMSGIMEKTELKYCDCLINEHVENKLISCADWHYFWEGIIAISYAENVKYLPVNFENEKDEVEAIVHDQNVVLIWSITDKLKPKLYLECDREVKTVAFCQFDENIVVGGCVNGQIVIWDIEGRLEEVEDESIKEDNEMWLESEIGWSREIHNRAVIRPIAVSDISLSHSLEITAISWISPNMEFTKVGKIRLIPEGIKRSKQFITISLDGNILIWDCDKITTLSTNYEHLYEEFINMKNNHPNLKLYELPNKQVDRNFKPIYKIIVGDCEFKKVKPLTCMYFQDLIINYELKTDIKSNRKMYKSNISESIEKDIPTVMWLGTLCGEVMRISWNGQPSDSDDIFEYCKYLSTCSIHNGPILAVVKNPFFKDIYASIGGKIMAVWSERLEKEPLFWKCLPYNLTDIKWSPYIPSQMFITTDNGSIEVWDFFHRSDAPFKIEDISGSPLTGMYIQKIPKESNLMAIGDCLGALRLYTLPKLYYTCDDKRLNETRLFFDREYEMKEYFRKFQEKWLEKHADEIETKRKLEIEHAKEVEKKQRQAKIREQELRELEMEAKKMEKDKSAKNENVEKWRRLQWQYAESVIQEKKMMNKSKLLKQQKPLQDLLTHIERRTEKVVDYTKKNKKVFEESVAIFFPEVKTKKQEALAITPLEEIMAKKAQYMKEYEVILKEAKEFLRNNSN